MAEIQDFNVVDAANTARWPEGMAPAQINNAARADEGILARWYADTNSSIASSGSSNTYAITSNRTIAAYFDNLVMAFEANHTNTGAATLNLNSLGAKDIKRLDGSALSAGDIVSGKPFFVVYDLGDDDWYLINPATAGDFEVPARAYDEYTDNSSITTVIPLDNSIPQSSEGTEILSAEITLTRADSRVRVRFQGFGQGLATDDTRHWTIALFNGGTDAIAASVAGHNVNDAGPTSLSQGTLEFEHAPGSVGPHTYTIRVGPQANTLRLNGNTSGRLMGGVARATLVVEELFV